jgi:hypothetical protein
MGRNDLAKVSLRVFFDEEECLTRAGWGADDGIHGPDDLSSNGEVCENSNTILLTTHTREA